MVKVGHGLEGYSGYVYAHDQHLVALVEPTVGQKYTITIVPTAMASRLPEVVSTSPPVLPQPARFDWNRLARREQLNLRQREQQLSPHGVSQEARMLFAALGKTLPCRWHSDNQTIIVMDEIYVCPPYQANSCRGNMRTAPSLIDRVRRVVELERQRLKLDSQ